MTTSAPSLLPRAPFETTLGGRQISLYTIKSQGGLTLQITNYGLRMVSLFAPDRSGVCGDVVIGCGSIGAYLHGGGERYLGCIVGRYANRIAGGRFTLDGTTYQAPLNDNGNTLHGGVIGFDSVVWQVEEADDSHICFSHTSPDGEDGFPAAVQAFASYSMTADNALRITYHAIPIGKPTILNLTNHCYFNLMGEGCGIGSHLLTIPADYITAVDGAWLPTGELMPVHGSPFDFRVPAAIGGRIDDSHPQFFGGSGYNHNYVIDAANDGAMRLAACVCEPHSGRTMEIYSNQPALQFYCGHYLDGKTIGKYGHAILSRMAFALEPQKYPDSPHHAHFPSTIVQAGTLYTHECIYKLTINN